MTWGLYWAHRLFGTPNFLLTWEIMSGHPRSGYSSVVEQAWGHSLPFWTTLQSWVSSQWHVSLEHCNNTETAKARRTGESEHPIWTLHPATNQVVFIVFFYFNFLAPACVLTELCILTHETVPYSHSITFNPSISYVSHLAAVLTGDGTLWGGSGDPEHC